MGAVMAGAFGAIVLAEWLAMREPAAQVEVRESFPEFVAAS
jgi:hypothetical protein